jgi:hypothetical protein
MNTATHLDRLPAGSGLPCADALELLSHGHEETRALADECRRLARCAGAERDIRPLVETLCGAMHRLAELEEELFYPAAREALEGSCAVDLAELEHATARQIIRLMQVTNPCEARYEALVVALADCVERHAQHEQGELFPRVRASCMDLAELGERLSRRRRELESAH